MNSSLPYRPCAGVVLTNANGLIFTGERIDTPGAWQMPQGGIDDGEDPKTTALRELEEETGVSPNLVEVLGETNNWVAYEFPPHIKSRMGDKFRGQTQKWFLFRFKGADHQIDIAKHDKEFARWRWSNPDEVIADIVPFKRDVYEQVIAEFRPVLEAAS